MKQSDIFDLRSALQFLNSSAQKIDIIDTRLSTCGEISKHFAYKGAGTPNFHNENPTNPTIYCNPNDCDIPILIGFFNDRNNTIKMAGLEVNNTARGFSECINNDFPPITISNPPCQENVVTNNIDVLQHLPILTYTSKDAGPFITSGLAYCSDPITGEEDVTIHRFCVQNKDTLSMYLVPGRHIGSFLAKAKELEQPLPITINIGFDPSIYVISSLTYPTTPLGFNELNVAGSIRGKGIEVAKAITVDAKCIAHSEFVIEGYIPYNEYVAENKNEQNGYSLPEFLGYIGKAQPSIPKIKITGITYRNNPIYQTFIGPGAEISNILALPTEASIYKSIREGITDKIINCYCPTSGGGKLLAVLQFKKTSNHDDAVIRQAGLAALSAFHELKNVFLVDDDVNLTSEKEILWAMTTRFQGTQSTISIPNLSGHPLDPSQNSDFSIHNSVEGSTFKTIFDCTVPFRMRQSFERASYD